MKVTQLNASYKNLPQQKPNLHSNEFVNFKSQIAFCNDILREVKHVNGFFLSQN